MKTLIITPTLRERANLERLIPELLRFAPGAHILVVDDQSRDGSRELIEQMRTEGKQVHFFERVGERGYGKAILDGFRFALDGGYDRVVTLDADFSHEPSYVPHLLAGLDTYDVSIGSRYVPGGGITNWTLRRRLLSRFANFYIRAILGITIHDNTTGFVAYRSEVIRVILSALPRSEGYAFLVECKLIASRKVFTYQEYPILFRDRREGQSKMSGKVIWESIWVPWRLRFRKK